MKTMYEVEWISDLPTVDGDSDFDRATYQARWFPSRGLAVAFAKKVGPDSPMGEAWLSVYRETHNPDDADFSEKGCWFTMVGKQEAIYPDSHQGG